MTNPLQDFADGLSRQTLLRFPHVWATGLPVFAPIALASGLVFTLAFRFVAAGAGGESSREALLVVWTAAGFLALEATRRQLDDQLLTAFEIS